MKSFLQSAAARLLLVCVIFSFGLLTGCGRQAGNNIPAAGKIVSGEISDNPEEAPEVESFTASESSKEAETEWKKYTDSELAAFDNTIQNWGQGVQFNSLNQPLSSLDFQEKYDSFQVNFIGPEENIIWLTFDEGYENGYTERILDTLKEKDCQAVFFVTGQYAQENPDLMKRMIAEGHAVGNHSWAHPSSGMPSLSIEDQIADMDKLHQFVKENYNYEMKLFRYPAGIFSEQSLAVVQSYGYRSLFWSFAYADWDPDKQPDQTQTLNKLQERLHPGSIYLLHAVSSTNAEILGDFIDFAYNAGYEFKLPE